jgi:hypothetical protein
MIILGILRTLAAKSILDICLLNKSSPRYIQHLHGSTLHMQLTYQGDVQTYAEPNSRTPYISFFLTLALRVPPLPDGSGVDDHTARFCCPEFSCLWYMLMEEVSRRELLGR